MRKLRPPPLAHGRPHLRPSSANEPNALSDTTLLTSRGTILFAGDLLSDHSPLAPSISSRTTSR